MTRDNFATSRPLCSHAVLRSDMQRLKAELAQLEKDNTDLSAQLTAVQAQTADTLASNSGACIALATLKSYDMQYSRQPEHWTPADPQVTRLCCESHRTVVSPTIVYTPHHFFVQHAAHRRWTGISTRSTPWRGARTRST